MNPSTLYPSGETMKNKIKKTATSTKDFVSRHRVGLAVTATAATALWMHAKVIDNVNEFLEAKGLLEEFYFLDEI